MDEATENDDEDEELYADNNMNIQEVDKYVFIVPFPLVTDVTQIASVMSPPPTATNLRAHLATLVSNLQI